MDRITFDFETGEIITDTDSQQGSMVDTNLKARKEAIYTAAGLELISGKELREEINKMMAEMGFDVTC